MLPAKNGLREGYRATARLPLDVLVRLFFDSTHGGPDKALVAARAWRTGQLAAAAVPDPPRRRVVLKPKSTSGVVGVHRRGGSAPAWVATYETTTGVRRARSFSVRRYGEAEARSLAIEERHGWEVEDLGGALPVIPDRRLSHLECLHA
jgi:hypothetical protein